MNRIEEIPRHAVLRLGFIVYFSVLSWQLLTPATLVSPGSWDKLLHFSGFFGLAALALLAWKKPAVSKAVVVLSAYAALTETLQFFIPGRSLSALDWLADTLGILLAVAVTRFVFCHRVSTNPGKRAVSS